MTKLMTLCTAVGDEAAKERKHNAERASVHTMKFQHWIDVGGLYTTHYNSTTCGIFSQDSEAGLHRQNSILISYVYEH